MREVRETRRAHQAREPAGFRSNDNSSGQRDAAKQASFNDFAKTVLARR